jgi:hypothetical protein
MSLNPAFDLCNIKSAHALDLKSTSIVIAASPDPISSDRCGWFVNLQSYYAIPFSRVILSTDLVLEGRVLSPDRNYSASFCDSASFCFVSLSWRLIASQNSSIFVTFA